MLHKYVDKRLKGEESTNTETMRISKHTLFHGTRTLERSFLGVENPHGDDLRYDL
jgi:hypothetical protein